MVVVVVGVCVQVHLTENRNNLFTEGSIIYYKSYILFLDSRGALFFPGEGVESNCFQRESNCLLPIETHIYFVIFQGVPETLPPSGPAHDLHVHINTRSSYSVGWLVIMVNGDQRSFFLSILASLIHEH